MLCAEAPNRAYSAPDMHIDFSTADFGYKEGEDYLILASRYSSVYDSEDRLSPGCDCLVLPIKSLNKGFWGKNGLKMYGTNLKYHIETEEARSAMNKGKLKEYILEQTKDNPLK